MIFPQPQWKWRTAYELVSYGFVDNKVCIYRLKGADRTAYVDVPTEFFQLIDATLSDAEKATAKMEGLHFYLDETPDGWVFGFEAGGGELYRDMWSYTKTKTPPWLDLALRSKR